MVTTMKTYARIQNGTVAELLRTDLPISGLFHPGLTWIDISDQPGIGEGWTFDGMRFAKAAVPASPVLIPTMAELLAELASLKAEVATLKAEVLPSTKHS